MPRVINRGEYWEDDEDDRDEDHDYPDFGDDEPDHSVPLLWGRDP